MLASHELDRICVVLVRARNPSNIGAVARAMHDFGFTQLRVVNEFAVPFEAAKSAVDASAVMASAALSATVAEAVSDCTLVIGTTAVGARDLQHELSTLAQAEPRIRRETHTDTGRIAILFGSEKTGLSNEELSHCHWLLTIPMYEYPGIRHPSMNLGQAVAVCLYELVRDSAAEKLPASATPEAPIITAEQERLTNLLSEVLEQTEYTRHHPANSDPAQIRRLVRKMNPGRQDAPVWMGILRQVLWKLRNTSKLPDR